MNSKLFYFYFFFFKRQNQNGEEILRNLHKKNELSEKTSYESWRITKKVNNFLKLIN